MAKKPQITKIEADISKLSIYLRSTKKWGKTTLFRDTVLAKFGDPSYGLLVGCGAEVGYTMLDNLNAIQAETWTDLTDISKWLLTKKWTNRDEKGRAIGEEILDHNVKMVAFDTGDELVLLSDQETIRQYNVENPNKKVKSIKQAFGGFTAGEKYSANDVLKPMLSSLKASGFGVWVIAHTSYKTIKEKGSLDEEGYMQLTSNLGKDYESAFGDVFDVVLTGVIDREFDEVTSKVMDKEVVKKYTTDTIRKLYFRGTTLIDAGGRFADGAVPEFMVFETGTDNASEFVKIVEEGMEKSRIGGSSTISKPLPKSTNKKPTITKPTPVIEEDESKFDMEDVVVEVEEATLTPVYINEDIVDSDDDLFADEVAEIEYPEDLKGEVTALFKACKDATLKAEVKQIISDNGSLSKCSDDIKKTLYRKLKGLD